MPKNYFNQQTVCKAIDQLWKYTTPASFENIIKIQIFPTKNANNLMHNLHLKRF